MSQNGYLSYLRTEDCATRYYFSSMDTDERMASESTLPSIWTEDCISRRYFLFSETRLWLSAGVDNRRVW